MRQELGQYRILEQEGCAVSSLNHPEISKERYRLVHEVRTDSECDYLADGISPEAEERRLREKY